MLRILIANNNAIIRAGFVVLLETKYPDCELAHAACLSDAIALLKADNYNLVILNPDLPGFTFHNGGHRLLEAQPGLGIIVYADHPEKLYAPRYLRQGFLGYVAQSSSVATIQKAIETVLKGNIYCSDEIIDMLAMQSLGMEPLNPFDELNDREFEICHHLLTGGNPPQIDYLNKSTIATRKKNMFKKLGVHNLVDFFRIAVLYGLKSPAFHRGLNAAARHAV